MFCLDKMLCPDYFVFEFLSWHY